MAIRGGQRHSAVTSGLLSPVGLGSTQITLCEGVPRGMGGRGRRDEIEWCELDPRVSSPRVAFGRVRFGSRLSHSIPIPKATVATMTVTLPERKLRCARSRSSAEREP